MADGGRRPGEFQCDRHEAQRRKIRKVHHDQVLTGFAGAAADAFTLVDRFETKLEEYQGSLIRAAVELAKDWRADRVLRRLEALLAGQTGRPR